jgi:hypothetical protein
MLHLHRSSEPNTMTNSGNAGTKQASGYAGTKQASDVEPNAATTTTTTPKAEFLCTMMQLDEPFTKKSSGRDTIGWGDIKDWKEGRLKSPPKYPTSTTAAASTATVVIEDEVDADQQHQTISRSFILGRPLSRPPVLPNCHYHNHVAVKKRDFDDLDSEGTTIDCRGKVYLPSGKSMDVPAKRMFRRCTAGLRMDPLSPPPFSLPKGRISIPH